MTRYPTFQAVVEGFERAEAREKARQSALEHATRRMLQALDAYWLHCDGLPKSRYPRGKYDMEDWWGRFEKYRAKVEAALPGTAE